MNISSEVKIGIIITIAIAMTIWGLNFLKGRNVLKRVDVYYAVFSDIGGLEKNSKIFISGYKVGQVENIVFASDGSNSLTITLGIEKEFRLPVPATAILYDADFMGTKAIRIKPGTTDSYHVSGDTLETLQRAGLLGQFEQQLGPIKDKTENLIVTLDSLLTALGSAFDRESSELIKSSVRKMESSIDGMENMLSDEGELQQLVSHLESITRNLQSQNKSLATSMQNIESITDSIAASQLKQAINNTNRTLDETRQIMEKINRGEGTAGMLVNNDTLYRNLESLSSELAMLLKDLQENPKKYVSVSVFGGSKKKD
jgi:phospholipid/cholesterol/gamma-HCH transport system substrate-binding protein